MKIKIAETEKEIENCYAVISELRPHLSLEEYAAQVFRQIKESNFRLVYLKDKEIKAVAGIRIAEWLAGGKNLEIEDFVTTESARSKGYGGELFDWIVEYARSENCKEIKLVSHVKRYGAHRFYLNKRMNIIAHYFSLEI